MALKKLEVKVNDLVAANEASVDESTGNLSIHPDKLKELAEAADGVARLEILGMDSGQFVVRYSRRRFEVFTKDSAGNVTTDSRVEPGPVMLD